jgi:hypothetical protein
MSTPIKITAPGAYLLATATPGDRTALPAQGAGAQILVHNASAQLAFLRFGDAAVTAAGGTAAPDIPVPPGTVMTLTRPSRPRPTWPKSPSGWRQSRQKPAMR